MYTARNKVRFFSLDYFRLGKIILFIFGKVDKGRLSKISKVRLCK